MQIILRMPKKDSFYNDLRLKLEETTTFPTKYMFKFIVPTQLNQVEVIKNMFNHIGAVITTKHSKSNTYQSLTILVMMDSVDAVIAKYEEVSAIKGVISL